MTDRKILLIVSLLIFAFFAVSCNGTSSSPTTTNQPTTASAIPPTPTATPTPKPTPHPAAQAALKSLRKVAGATEIGINVQEYGSRLIDTKADVDEQLAQLPDGEVKKEIELALQAYIDAKSIWSDFARYDFVLADERAASILKKYKIPTKQDADDKRLGLPPSTNKQLALSLIWKAADGHIEKATKLMNQ